MRSGGDIDLANGESEARGALRVMMTASMREVVDSKARATSVRLVGVPWMSVTPSCEATVEGFRTRAVMVCPRERAWAITCCPVRPLPPRMRKCMLWEGL